MNSKIDNGYFEIHCHGCSQWLELGDIWKIDNEVICLYCGTKLGYIHDIPKAYRRFICGRE